MKLLVTGGAGFIGSHFVRYWLTHHPSDKVRVLDKLTYAGHIENLQNVRNNPQLQFLQGDITDEVTVYNVMRGVDIVVNCAAETHVDRALAGPKAGELFQKTNYEGTRTLLKAARDMGIDLFHQLSTDEVFGELDLDAPNRFNERSPYNPRNPYAKSKADADMAVLEAYRTGGPPVTISYSGNNYGSHQTPEKMIPRSIALLIHGEKIKLFKDAHGNPGRNVRDWLYVEDHCRALEAILLRGRAGETYCVGGNNQISNHELVEKILALMSEVRDVLMTFENHVELVPERAIHDLRYDVDTTKIERELGWRPEVDFDTGLRRTLEWYVSDEGREWLEPLYELTRDIPREGIRTGVERR